jgi:hypothetical protein
VSALAVAPEPRDCVEGQPTLDDLVVGVWEGLAAHAVVACPVCDGAMVPGDVGRSPVEGTPAGRCGQCRTVIW